MFDFIFSGLQAYNQVAMFIGALICLGIGGLILGSSFYWRLHALRATGTIIGVIGKDGMYAPVYRYTLKDGQTHEAKSDTSSGWLRGKETGRVVQLLISPHNPTQARSAHDYLFDLVGVVFLVPGVWLGYTAVTAYPVTRMTWIIAGLMILYLAERVHRIIIPKGARLSIAEWRKQHNLGSGASLDLNDVKPIEQLVSASGLQQARQIQARLHRKLAPVVGLFALILAGVGAYQSIKVARLEANGLRAPGEVISLKEEFSSDSTSYYPIVRYRTDKDLTVEFKDSIGGNPPTRRPGDKVTVLYLADKPQSEAIIDRGVVWNWAIPAILLVAAAFITWLAIFMLRGAPPQKSLPGGPPQELLGSVAQ